MKKNLIILCCIFIFFCTGCSNIKYSLIINKDGIQENVSLTDESLIHDDLPDGYMSDMSAFEILFQSLPYESGSDSKGNNYAKKSFKDFNTYIEDSFVYLKYLNSEDIKIDGKKVKINISKDSFKAIYNVDAVEISLYIPYYVSSHNATKVSNDTYTWVIDDIENANIKINFDMGKDKNFKQTLVLICTIGIVLVIIGATVVYFVINNKKNNEI